MIKEANNKEPIKQSVSKKKEQEHKDRSAQAASPTNPFEGERRKQHHSWMSVMSEGNLTPKG